MCGIINQFKKTTMTKKKITTKEVVIWDSGVMGNEILQGEGFFISYNPRPVIGNGRSETALVVKENGVTKFYILEGNWKKNYEAVYKKGLDACKTIFNNLKSRYKSSWSN